MPEDRAAVEIWQIEQAHKHHVCGTFDWEWEEDPEAWRADVHWCIGCYEIETLRAQIAREHPHGEGVEGWTIRLYKGDVDGSVPETAPTL